MVRKNPVNIYLNRKKSIKVDIEEWRKYWKEAGPIRFAEEYLFCPPQVPSYPDWKNHQKSAYCEGCGKIHNKFDDNGIPIHIILSDEHIEFLMDIWKRGIRLALVSAGRGAGKTFILAVWEMWRLCTENFYEISYMGGSAGQAKVIQKYHDYWRLRHKEVGYIVYMSTKSIGNRACITRMGAEVGFAACSPTAAMGPHVNEVHIDEVCAAESKGIEGIEAIEAIDWQVTGRKDTYVFMTSTSHYLLGKFYQIYRKPEKYGFKRYIWSIAKHISGKPVHLMYKDRAPEHWLPAVWWITKEDIYKLRKRKSNEEWLCWALGRASLASGALFNDKNLNICICPLCPADDCQPYNWKHCKLVKKYGLGTQDDPIKFVKDRKSALDYGDPAPCAFGIGGIKGKFIFILYADEMKGINTTELVSWIERELQRKNVHTFNIPDSIGGKHIAEILDDKGYAINYLSEVEKEERVQNVKSIVEKRAIIIPPAFWHLCESLRGMHRDKRGRIVKHNDHCLIDDTEILTENGWKLFKDLIPNEKVATRDKNGCLVYQYPTEYIEENYDGDIFLFENRSVSFGVSPNHNFVHIRQCDYRDKKDDVCLSRFSRLPENIFIPKSIKWNGIYKDEILIPSQSKHPKHKKIGKLPMNEFLAFLGLWLAEGCISKSHYQVIIDQNKKKEWKLKEIFDNIGLKYHKWDTGQNRIRYAIQSIDLYYFFKKFGKSDKKYIPNWVFKLPKEQLNILFDNLMFGDGTDYRITKNNTSHYDTVSKRLADDFQRLIFHLGLVGNVKGPYKTNGKPCYRINIWKSKIAAINKEGIKKSHYKGKIYCVNVPNHIIYVRRNGRPMWTGNSFDMLCYLCIDWGLMEGSISDFFDVINEMTDINVPKIEEDEDEYEEFTKNDDDMFFKKGIKFWDD